MIEKTPGVCGGSACFSGTRIPVWVVLKLFQEISGDEILKLYPQLTWGHLWAAREYAWENADEIVNDMLLNEE